MRKKSTRLLSAALAVCMMASTLPVSAFAAQPAAASAESSVSTQAEEDAVAIDATNFPDGAFRQYVADNFDKDKDGALNQTERNAVKEIWISNSGCTSLQGLKYFSKLTDLFCSDNNLTELDVSENPELKRLICYNNSLTSLNLNKNTKLESLNCNKNKLTVLDLRENKSLWWLRCNNNCLTSLDLRNNPKIVDLQVGFQRYQILANDDRTYDLHQLPGKFELDDVATGSWEGGTVDPTTWILKANSTTVTYKYKVDDEFRFPVTLDVHWHNYQWNHDGTKHWRECTTANCPGLTDAQEAPHVYDNAKDKDCNTCGYVRPLYTVTTVNATAKLESEAEELKAPVAAGTEVILTAGDAPEGKTFAGWKLYKVVSDTESQITDETELAELLKNGTETTATLTMPAYDVKAEPYYSNIPYNITPVNCTVDKTEAAKGDTVTATRRKPEANERFIDWTVKVSGVKQPDDFLTPDADDPAKVSFVMPAENVEIKANFASNPTLNPTLRVGDHVTATIEGSDASVPSGSTVPVGETVHLTAIAPEGQHFTGWTVKVGGEEQKADTFLTTPDENDPTKVTFTMPDKNVEVKATFEDDPIPEPDPVGPSDTGNIQGAISAVVVGAAAGAIIYEAGTGIYRVINMPGIPMPSNRIELAELLWEHAGKPEPVSTALYSDIDEGDTDAQKAARWAVEQDLMKDDADNNKFHPAFPVSKLRTCLTWNAAKEKGLFDKTEE